MSEKYKKNYTSFFMILIFALIFWPIFSEKILRHDDQLFCQSSKDYSAKDSASFKDNEKTMSMHVIDVQKGDAIYINCGEKNILVDSGEYSYFKTVDKYLKEHDVKKLDLVVVTHPHTDHMGSMSEIIKKYKIEKFIMPQVPESITPTSSIYKFMLEALKEKEVAVQKPNPLETFSVGDITVTVLAPIKQYQNTNDNSVVICVTFKNKKILLTGDAEKGSEEDILRKNFDIKADILKVAHHGSNTSTTDAFLKKISPKYAVLSTSEEYIKNFNFKGPKSLKKLEKRNIKTFRTDLNGNIIFITNGEEIKVKCEKNKN